MLQKIRRTLVQNALFIVPLLVVFGLVACDDGVVTPKQQEAKLGANLVGGRDLKGQDYYSGIFFGKGPVASAIPEIRDNYAIASSGFTSEELANIDGQQTKLMNVINAYDSGFFGRFEGAIESGDRTIIEGALKEAGAVTLFAYLQTDEGRQALGVAQDPENIQRITEEVNLRGGVGQLTEQQVKEAIDQVAASASHGAAIGQANFALCLVVAIALVVVVAVALVLVLAAAVAVAIALIGWLWVVIHTYFWVWAAKAKGMLTELQIEQMVDSLSVKYRAGAGPIEQPAPIGTGS